MYEIRRRNPPAFHALLLLIAVSCAQEPMNRSNSDQWLVFHVKGLG